jgi:hypothetical protein
MIENRYNELRRLVSVLKSIGSTKDYPTIRDAANWLQYYSTSNQPSPVERQKGVVQKLQELPELLKTASERARKEEKKKRYDSILSTVNYGFPTLLDSWRYWNKSKDELLSIVNNLTIWEREIKNWLAAEERFKGNSILFFTDLNTEIDETKASGRFILKVQELLPKERVTVQDYETLIKELETCITEWGALNLSLDNQLKIHEFIVIIEGYISELHVRSLMEG